MTLRTSPAEIVRESNSPLLAMHASWERVRLGDVANVQNGFAFKSEFFDPENGMPLVRIRDVGSDKTVARYTGPFDSTHVLSNGDLLIGMDGDFRVARWRGGQALLNQRVCRIKVRSSDYYDERFLHYVLQGYLDAIHEWTSSVTVKHLSSRDIEEIPLPLPPLAEQQRIVKEIESLDSHLDSLGVALSRTRRNLVRLIDSILQTAVRGELVSQDPSNEPSEKLLRDAGVEPSGEDPLQHGWCWSRLGDVARMGSGATPLRSRKAFWDGGEIPWVTSGLLNREFVRETKEFITPLALKETSVKMWPVGTLLVAMYGEGKTRGRCSELMLEATTNQACAAIVLEPPFDAYRGFIKTFLLASYQANRRLAVGGVQPNLSLGVFKNMAVPLPPVEEATRIVAEVEKQISVHRKVLATVVRSLDLIRVLRLGVLARAFGGSLVPQDAEDESAVQLLKRIMEATNA